MESKPIDVLIQHTHSLELQIAQSEEVPLELKDKAIKSIQGVFNLLVDYKFGEEQDDLGGTD